jgi:hypothetical protein
MNRLSQYLSVISKIEAEIKRMGFRNALEQSSDGPQLSEKGEYDEAGLGKTGAGVSD